MMEMNKAMAKDSDMLSRPISFPVKTQSDVRRIFDSISYSKGACLINMMRAFLGETTFREALKNYLIKFEYGNAEQDDLWDIMTEEAHKADVFPKNLTVKQIMDTWTLQPGYPVVSVIRNGSDLIISQQRYLLPELSINESSKWIIPISFATKDRVPNLEVPEYWLTDKSDEIIIENAVGENDYFYLNINRTGYYRVNYDPLSWKSLIFNMDNLPQIARAQLVDDAFNLARANIIEYDVPLTTGLVLLKIPKDYLSWWAFSDGIQYLSNMVKREAAYESFRAIMKNLIKTPYTDLGFDEIEGESHTELIHRARIVRLACEYGIDRCTNRAQILYRDWMSDRLENRYAHFNSQLNFVVTFFNSSLEYHRI